ncbi:hypothetical protein JOB18_009223 [Solea senegalensis]|uniref:Uncharacterized protein n=1 Tax=Solea senegalensis TaxID=28829 RepID=A0AAV6QS63_SOLSE|nr:hypothetical protein JOB18_009223 [Solea senegalensis]
MREPHLFNANVFSIDLHSSGCFFNMLLIIIQFCSCSVHRISPSHRVTNESSSWQRKAPETPDAKTPAAGPDKLIVSGVYSSEI